MTHIIQNVNDPKNNVFFSLFVGSFPENETVFGSKLIQLLIKCGILVVTNTVFLPPIYFLSCVKEKG